MHTKMSASGSEEAGKGYPRGAGAVAGNASVRRLKAIGYLALLLAILPAATCIAMGRAGVPAPFSTACGVVSCVAAGHAL
ncbi:hypothetical protein [Janthinobacterium sp. BJB301]|uniref:hypothetical protein n=1 Tax=Janthinobacterium sp. BJB301 TaxID=1560195 RepID=UPI00117AC134|nr:hypothetical protein [Janthinobacterium sp. BJB301]